MANIPISKLQQFLERASSAEVRDKVGAIYMENAKDMLMSPPFCYDARTSADVAEGIVKHGDKISCNCGQGDVRMDELNAIGDAFQALQRSTALKVISGENMGDSALITSDDIDTSLCNVASFADTLLAVRDFVKTKAQRGFGASIVMLCEYNEDGVVFTSGHTVPVEILENEIQLLLKDRGGRGQILPIAVNLLIESHGKCHHLSQIHPDHVERFRM